jgi:exopolysaccharide biosynthesis polyprenyl glycosylphosphotransferase
VPDLVAELGADAVLVAGQLAGGTAAIRSLGWALEPAHTELVLVSSLVNVAGPRITMRPVEGLPLMHVDQPRFEGGRHVVKRVLDVVVASLALLAMLPLFAVLAVLIRRDSGGPVFFSQTRNGRHGETFRMHKFRTMVTTAERDRAALVAANQGAGPLFKMKDDPRVTHVGAVLRRHSLDELPQFWNVLKGEMSLVGPRPPLPEEVASYEGHTGRRLYIKPGLTGLWQINGRSNLDWEESVRLDLYYVENWSVTGDLMIMWRTFKVMVRPEGAY